MTMDIAASVTRNRLLSCLASSDLALLDAHIKEVTIETGTLLHEAGAPVDYVFFPYEGMVSLLAVMSDGESIETATVGSEGVVGANSGFGAQVSFTRAVVQAPLVAARLPAPQFRAAVQRSARLCSLMAVYNELLLAHVQQTAACNALHTIESRLARWLLQTRDRLDSDVLPLTQEFLSQMLGVRRSTVNLVARQLQNAGTIILRRGRIIISDRVGLEDVACECYGIVRDQLTATLTPFCPAEPLASGNGLTGPEGIFYIAVPAVRVDPASFHPPCLDPGDSVDKPLAGRTTLIVEDEMLIAMAVQTLLLDLGADRAEIADANAEALTALRSDEPVDLVILDLHVKDGDTTPLIGLLSERGIPFIVTTGGSLTEDEPDLSQAVAVLDKPCPDDLLIAAVKRTAAHF